MMTGSSFEMEITVAEEHLDELGHVNNVVYLGWIQDIAKKHWSDKVTQAVQDQVIWVVTRHEIDYKLPCLVGEKLVIRTATAPDVRGPLWDRYVWIYKPEGQVAVSATTTWCLLDRNTHKIKRITSEIYQIFNQEGKK